MSCGLCKPWKRLGNSTHRHSHGDAVAIEASDFFEEDESVVDIIEAFDRGRPVTTRRRKNTRRWCRGVEGREHDFEIVELQSWSWYRLNFGERCKRCRKVVNPFSVYLWKPEWLRRLEERRNARLAKR